MSKLAALLESQGDTLIERWTERIHRATAPAVSPLRLRNHVPALLRELRDALREGRGLASSEASPYQEEHPDGFDVDGIVREYRALFDVILDAAETGGVEPTIPEMRLLSEFVFKAVAEGLAAHQLHAERATRKAKDLALHEESRANAALQRLEGLFTSAPAFMAATQGPSHVFALVNEPYQRLVGAGRPLVGLTVAAALPEVVAQGFIDLLDGVYRTGTPHRGRELVVRLDRGAGELEDAYLDFVYQPIRGGDGAIEGIDVFGFDVTEQVRARRHVENLVGEVRAQEAELQLVMDALPLLVSFVTPDERYGLVNKAYETWFGVSREMLRGRKVSELLGEAAYAVLSPYIKRALGGEPFSIEQIGVPYRLGGTRDVKVTFVPRHGESGQIEGYVGLLEDITERRLLEAEREHLFVAERAARREADTQREHLRTLVATAPIGIATWSGPTHVFDTANARYLAAFGKTVDVLGQSLAVAFADEPAREQMTAIFDEVFATGVPFVDSEHRVKQRVDDALRVNVYVLHVTPIRDLDDAVSGVMSCVLDVTEAATFRELAEIERDLATAVATMEASSRQAADDARDATEFLLRMAAALSESLDLDVMRTRLVELIAPSRAKLASVWSASSDEPYQRRTHAPFSEVLADRSSSLPPSSGDPAGRAAALPVERVVATGQRLHIPDYRAWMIEAGAARVAEAMATLGVGPVLLLPVRRGNQLIAVLSIARGTGEAFKEEDIALFESVAGLAALAFENARLFREMVLLRKSAEDATVAKDRFLAHVSHDLRNPLTSILGWSALLREMKDDPAQLMRGIDVIERNAKSQVQLIEDLLDVSRIAAGKLTLELAVEDVRAAIDTGLDPARIAASAKNVELVVSVEDDIGAIAVDPDRFRQIVWNLVSNAVKFTPPSGTVRVQARRLTSTFQLTVADNGRGIAPEFLPRIFSPFEQAEAGARRSGGLGLGLAIVRQLVELHGGTITVESAGEGRGACFTIDLPIRAAIVPTDPQAATARTLSGVRVLVVDDEEDAREVVTVILEHAGATVTAAASADEGLAVVVRSPPDVITSDISMPLKDGKAFMRDVRKLPEAQGGRVPSVALTALARAKDRIEILSAGFDAHVAKPVEPEELVLVVAKLVGRHVTATPDGRPD